VLMKELQRKPLEPLKQLNGLHACIVRVDQRISKDVWVCCMHFLYSGQVRCAFSQDLQRLTQLLRACVTYQLPRPLLDFTEAALCPLLPSCTPRDALEVFSISAVAGTTAAADKRATPAQTRPALQAEESSAYWVLRGAHDLCREMEPKDMAALMDRALCTVEQYVFRHK